MAPRIQLLIPIGVAGSGKTSFYEKLKDIYPLYRISPDAIRFSMLKYSETKIAFDERIEPEVWLEAYSIFEIAVSDDRPFIYFDATNLTKARRYELIQRAQRINHRIEISMYYFNLPLVTILQANQNRERKVDEKVIAKQYTQLEPPEGWEFDHFWVFNSYEEIDNEIQILKEVT